MVWSCAPSLCLFLQHSELIRLLESIRVVMMRQTNKAEFVICVILSCGMKA